MIELRAPGIEAAVVPLGARLARLRTPDRAGTSADVVLGLDSDDYRGDRARLGATIGRYANRIAGGTFEIDGNRYSVPTNQDGAALHGGPHGFDQQIFDADPVRTLPGGGRSVTFRRTSPDGENGFPGNLEVAVTYTVRTGAVDIEHTARTDRPTVVNLTNHSYFNLTGRGGSTDGHLVHIPAAHYLPVDHRLIPTGEIAPVDGTPFDLREGGHLGTRTRRDHPQLLRARGFDHTMVLDGPPSGMRLAARVDEPGSGRTLTVLTDQPGFQLYTGNALDGSIVTRGGRTVRQGDAFCIEPQHFPDSPNRPGFPSTVLRPGELYRSRITFRLGVLG
ncbi:galactose mutarotase [Pseudonocardia eucalypti]|uniref:Aldose 1-epimerase n=1 Tax=Pseudonocardia eucalypti TaxID=648755 RepID=A0ABP9QGI8_9PSEU|nr:aldose 1-epimerase [Pseudonocardia eucalypti]